MQSSEAFEAENVAIDRGMAEIFASEINAVVTFSPDKSYSRTNPDGMSEWCEVEVVEGSEIVWQNREFQAPYTRIFLRHDTIDEDGYKGVLYRLLIEAGLVTMNTHRVPYHIVAYRKAVMMNILEDEEEPPLLFQAYLKDPTLQLTANSEHQPAQLDSLDLEQLANSVAFGQLIKSNFVALRRMTQFDLDELYNQVAMIADARKKLVKPKDN